jgi:hypothetical protein
VQVDPESFEVNSDQVREPGSNSETAFGTSELDDTQLMQSRSIPTEFEAQSSVDEPGSSAAEKEFNVATDYSKQALDRTLDEAEEIQALAPREDIWIETMGEDFLGESLDDDFAEETAEDAPLVVESLAGPGIENDDKDLEPFEVQAIEPESPEVEATDIAPFEAEAIELESSEGEAEDLEVIEAEAIELESSEGEAEDLEVTRQRTLR